jgi:Rps23 Pro-64 3,4-dihydroxylase Tpa1-like proline 4-hydroxylase
VFFPSQSEHEILPVRVPSRAFGDGRFTVNGWIHRAPAAGAGGGKPKGKAKK